jgi:hypothetical protein
MGKRTQATIVALAALIGITVLGALGDVGEQALIAVYSAVIGSAITNGATTFTRQGSGNGGRGE